MNPLSSHDAFGIDRYIRPISPSGAKRRSPDFSEESGLSAREIQNTASRIAADYLQQIVATQGACFRTEIRDSGTYICGVHHGLWSEESASTCQDQLKIAQGLKAAVIAQIEKTFEARRPAASPPKALVDLWMYEDFGSD